MADNWDDSDDDWDKSDDELDKRLGLAKIDDSKNDAPAFDDEEEDLLIQEKEADAKASAVTLKAKGSALAKKKVSSQCLCRYTQYVMRLYDLSLKFVQSYKRNKGP
jgi:hypothetical protein